LIAAKPWDYWAGIRGAYRAGISFGTIVPAATAITRWFQRYRGRAMAGDAVGVGICWLYRRPVINRILAANGGNWRQAWAIVAGISVLSAVVAFLFVRERPEDLASGGWRTGRVPLGESAAASARVTKFPWEPQTSIQNSCLLDDLVGAIACQFPFFFSRLTGFCT